MLIKDAVELALNDWASAEGFEFNDQIEWLEQHVTEIICDWAEARGYVFNEAEGIWEKSGE